MPLILRRLLGWGRQQVIQRSDHESIGNFIGDGRYASKLAFGLDETFRQQLSATVGDHCIRALLGNVKVELPSENM